MDPYKIIVVGASSGGVEALRALFRELKPHLNAAVFIVLHIPPDAKSFLPQILGKLNPMPVQHAQDGAKIRSGHVYIAPPNQHLILENGTMRLTYGPKVNHTRPAIDPLFESAARQYGNRVIGVLMSGNLFDGTKGLLSIQQAGGKTVVQDPEEALFSSMPVSALQSVPIDYSLPVSEIATLLNNITEEAVLAKGETQVNKAAPGKPEDEMSLIKKDFETYQKGYASNQRSVLACPDCGGILWEFQDSSLVRYRCHTGHIYNAEVILSSHDSDLEKVFWTAIRLLVEKAAVSNRLAIVARETKNPDMEAYYLSLASEAEKEADRIRETWFRRSPNDSRKVSAGEQASKDITQAVNDSSEPSQ